MISASFQVEVTYEDAIAFAKLSGDWNPLHTDPEHAATQIAWLFENSNFLVSGANISFMVSPVP